MNTDPIADLLTRVRNAQKARMSHVQVPYSKMKEKITDIFKAEGFIEDASRKRQGKWEVLELTLRYERHGEPMIKAVKRMSRPGRRLYVSREDLLTQKDVINTKILTTSKGIMTDREAFEAGLGGEIICLIS